MRLAALLLLLASAASAQAPLFPNGTGLQTAAPHWRASVSGGMSGAVTGIATLGLERTLAGPVSLGGRGVLYTSGRFADDGERVEGGAFDVLASVSNRDRIIDLRAFAGVGVSVVERSSSGFREFRAASTSEGLFGPHLVAGVGLDLYPLAGIGVGVEARGVAAPLFGTSLSTVAVGLRVRLAR